MNANQTELLNRIRTLQDGGPSDAAIAELKKIIDADPDQADALLLLGAWAVQRREFDSALGWIARAQQARPNSAVAHNYRGIALRRMGRVNEAIACFRRSLALKPGYAEACNNLGTALLGQGNLEDARDAFQRAVSLKENFAEAQSNLCSVLNELGDHAVAVRAGEAAIALKPDLAAAQSNLAEALAGTGQHERAFACFERAIELQPAMATAHNGHGNLLQATGRHAEAIEAYEKALKLAPDFARVHNNLGNALVELGRYPEAALSFRKALELQPHIANARTQLVAIARRTCDWNTVTWLMQPATDGDAKSINLFPFEYLGLDDDPAVQFAVARRYADTLPQRAAPRWAPRRSSTSREKLRIGYYSADYRTHPVAQLITGLLTGHDRNKFEVHGLSYGPGRDDPARARLATSCDQFTDLASLSDTAAAAKIRELKIDILVDLTGWTRHSRTAVLAQRPAPIQVSYLGYPGTLGTGYIDYLIGDRHVTPPTHQDYYTEQLIQLPGTYQVNAHRRLSFAPAPKRKFAGLPEKGLVFCCFNSPSKFNLDMFLVWLQLLREVPSSVLWLIDDNPAAQLSLCRQAGAGGVDPGRLIFAPKMPLADHLARHQLADLFLDTWPYNAHTTASDALWSGVPIVTRAGRSFASRAAASLLDAAGLSELVTATAKDYYELALKLARDPDILGAIRAELTTRRRDLALFDTANTTGRIEWAYEEMWRRFQAGARPQGFQVPPAA